MTGSGRFSLVLTLRLWLVTLTVTAWLFSILFERWKDYKMWLFISGKEKIYTRVYKKKRSLTLLLMLRILYRLISKTLSCQAVISSYSKKDSFFPKTVLEDVREFFFAQKIRSWVSLLVSNWLTLFKNPQISCLPLTSTTRVPMTDLLLSVTLLDYVTVS